MPAGVYRCDDFDGARKWNLLDNIRKVTLQGPQAISGDWDTYGTVYVACGNSGYVWGRMD